jgi:phosphate transport system substrate-binding protein
MSAHIASWPFAYCLRAAAPEAHRNRGSRCGLRIPILLTASILWLGFAQALAADDASIKIGGAGSSLSTMRLLAAAFEKANPEVTVTVLPSLGSSGGIRAAASGAVDIGTSARRLSGAELDLPVTAHEFGWTPLVFAVSRATRATGVTTAQLVDIYAGKMTAWPSGDPIRVIIRPSADTDTIKLQAISAQMRDAVTAAGARPGMLTALTDADVIEQVNSIPGALGVTSLSEVRANAPRLKTLKLDGVEPSPASLADDTYPLFLSMLMVTGKTPSALASRFIDFALSAPGRKILSDAGYAVPAPSHGRQP